MNNNIFKAKGYTSTIEASKALRCSRNHVYQCILDGRLKGKSFTWGKRTIQMVLTKSLMSYILHASDNRRIGRELFCRSPNRAPTMLKGYRYIFKPEHHRAMSDGYVAEHYLVAEQMLNRPLTKTEVVHHRNRVRDDNSPDNLVIYDNQAMHMSYEHGSNTLYALYLRIKGNTELENKAIDFLNSLLSDTTS